MDILRRLFGGDEPRSRTAQSRPLSRQMSSDEQAVERYRYLLRTAPPETIEEAHAEAFAKLTPEQRRMVLQELDSPTPRRPSAPPVLPMTRIRARCPARHPGRDAPARYAGADLVRMPAGMGMGGLMAGNFTSTIAGVMVGSMIADAFLGDAG